MTPIRAGVSLFLIAAICLTVVVLRSESVRLMAEAQRHEAELLRLRREAWNIQMEIARLRSPEQIQGRIHNMDLNVSADFQDLISAPSDTRFAEGRR
jgi:hypothetical protein